MKSRIGGAWISTLLLQFFLVFNCMAAEKPPVHITSKELESYWVIAQEDMPSTMPPLVREAFGLIGKHKRIVLDYEVTINTKGVPVDFKFKSITPANVTPKPFIAFVMFKRYRPAPRNGGRAPVRLHGPMPFFIPK